MKILIRALRCVALPCLILVLLAGCSGGSGPSSAVTPTPSISSVTPSSVQANQAAPFSVTITGSGFISTSQVQVNGSSVTTTYVSATQLQAQIPASLATSGGQLVITVTNGSVSSGPPSSGNTITVTNPTPAITSLSPSSAAVNGGPVTVTVTGTGFVPTTTLSVGGASHSVTYVSSTQLTVALSLTDLASTGSLSFVVSNAPPAGGSSSAVPFSVVNPTPSISSINPASVTAGGSDLTLTVQGTGFLSTSTVLWNGTGLTTTFVSGTQLAAVVPAASTATGATAQVTVMNPSPGGGTSSPTAFTVNAPAPVLTGISPHTVKANQAATITLTGSGFTSNSVAQWNGSNASTTFVNATTLQVAFAAADLSTVQTGKLSVVTPAPGGGTSSSLPLVVTNLPIPTISNVSISTATTNGCSQLQFTATGTNFVGNVTFQVGGLTIGTFGSSTNQTGALPTGFSAQATSMTFTAVSNLTGTGISSEPFALPASTPAVLAICAAPNGATIYPGSSFVATFTPSTVNAASPATITSVTPPTGVTASNSLPLSLAAAGSRMTFQASTSLAAGTIAIPFSASDGNATATGSISFVVSSATPPGFFFPSGLIHELAIPIGGSGKISFQTLANSSSATDYTIDLAVSGLPEGATATVTPSTIIPGDTFAVTVMAASNAPVSQNTTITVTGTPSSTAPSATTTFLLDVTQAPGNLPNNRSDFVSTAATPAAMVYNRALDVIYVSNPAWNRIDIISNATHKLLQSVPVRGPSGIDLSQDGSTLWIGTQSQQIYAMNTTSFALNTYMAPPLSGVYSNQTSPYKWQDTQLFALANDTLLLSVTPQPGSGINYVAIWNPSTNALTNVPATSSYYFNLRSGDHTKAYGWSANSVNCQVMVYDSTVQQTSTFPTLNEPCSFSAVNYNGTRFVGENNSHWALYDGSFQLIGNLPTSLTSTGISFYGGWVFSPDGSTLYQIGSNFGTSGAYIQTFDVASLTLKGTAPALSTQSLSTPVDVDQNGILLGIQNFGVGFDDSTFFQTYPANPVGETWPVLLTPRAGPLGGGTSSAPYGFYDITPDVWYGANRGSASVDASNSLTIVSPAGNADGPVNVKFLFPNGDQIFMPQAFSYSVFPEYSILSGASPNGGVPGEIAGYGMPADASGGTLTIGGSQATITTTVTQYPPYTAEPFPSTYLNYTVPAGTPGYADLQITTPNGSGTLPKAIFYAKSVTDYASSDTFTDVLYDEARKQVYLSAADHIDVLSISSGQFLTPLKPANLNGTSSFRGLALTPDGSLLLAANMTDGSLGVINPDSPSQTYAIAIATPTGTGTTCATGTFAVTALAGNQAFVSSGLPPGIGGCPGNNQLYAVNLQAKSAAVSNPFACGFSIVNLPAALQSTADGTAAMISTLAEGGTCLYSSKTNTFTLGPGAASFFGATIAADGNIAAVGNEFSDLSGNALGLIGRPVVFYGSQTPYALNNYPNNTLLMPRLNASGSLYFWAFPNYFEIIDVPTGTLRMRFSLSETVQNVEAPIAVDSAGQQVFLITSAGLTVVDLGTAPLSIGHLTPNGGVAGTQIQVRGSGFVTGATVLVGGQSATVTVVDESTLNLAIPSVASGAQDLTIKNPDGGTYTLKSAIAIP